MKLVILNVSHSNEFSHPQKSTSTKELRTIEEPQPDLLIPQIQIDLKHSTSRKPIVFKRPLNQIAPQSPYGIVASPHEENGKFLTENLLRLVDSCG